MHLPHAETGETGATKGQGSRRPSEREGRGATEEKGFPGRAGGGAVVEEHATRRAEEMGG